jgi:outer membrane protein OmpA-like peptidoglycan-associated protein
VTGYTDWIGDPKHNLELSTARASSAAAALRLPTGSVAGFGRERPQTDNRLPEGRFYNRTVQIIVERPIQN